MARVMARYERKHDERKQRGYVFGPLTRCLLCDRSVTFARDPLTGVPVCPRCISQGETLEQSLWRLNRPSERSGR